MFLRFLTSVLHNMLIFIVFEKNKKSFTFLEISEVFFLLGLADTFKFVLYEDNFMPRFCKERNV